MFKITYPVAVSLHACRSAGRGRGRLSGFPLYDVVGHYIMTSIRLVLSRITLRMALNVISLEFFLGHTPKGK